MKTLTIRFFPPENLPDAKTLSHMSMEERAQHLSDLEEHFRSCLGFVEPFLQNVGHVGPSYPSILETRMECPAEHVEDVMRFISEDTRLGVVEIMHFERKADIGGEGGQ